MTFIRFYGIIEYQQFRWYLQTKQKENTMSNVIAPTVGSQFTTQRAGIVGIVQEVVLNKTGTYRVRLDVNGDTRWTTVK